MIRELGKGAMGVVYLGRDPVIGRLVALKTIRAVSEDDVEQREFQERFLREAQAAGILSHPNIVTVHDVGEDSSTATSFIAMEYVEGKNLKQLLSEKTPFTFERVAEVVGQVAEALDYAHRRGIVHRDVKPANIIITPENQVKITDFGIAKTEKSNLTTTGQFLGTPNYMSPEQVTGDAVDGRSDLFSLGVVLYELLTRKKPFTAENLTSISYKIVHEQFVAPETYDASIPPEFTGVLDRALAKDPAERFQRGNDFALALYEFKAREEERQMLRDLGQMVAEAERLGPVATVTAPPTPLAAPAPAPSTPAPASAPPAARSPFEILAATPAPASQASLEDDLATREVARPLPATAYVAPTASPNPDGAGSGAADWQLDEPTKSKKAPPPPAPPERAIDVDESLPGPEVVEPPPRPRGLAVSPFDAVPSAPGLESHPDGATEIIRVDGLAGLAPTFPAPSVDRPTEILAAITPPVAEPAERPAVPVPAAPSAPPSPAPAPPVVDRPTEILQAIVPPAQEPFEPELDRPTEILKPLAPPPVAAEEEPNVDRPTEILRVVPPPAAASSVSAPPAPPVATPSAAAPVTTPPSAFAPATTTPSAFAPAKPAPTPVTPSGGSGEKPTEILRSPFAASAAPAGPSRPAGDSGGEEGATERIVDAYKLAKAGAPPARLPVPPPVAAAPAPRSSSVAPPSARPVSSAANRVPTPPASALPPVELAPIPETGPPPPAPPAGPMLKRAINIKFVAAIIALVVVAAGAVTGVLWSQKRKIDAQAAVDEVREREVQELKALMEDGNRLLVAGNAGQALEKFREVIRRKPDSSAAREAVARAEEQLRSSQAGADLDKEVETRLAAAREAAELGEFDRSLDQLSAVLLLKPEHADALALRESVKAAQAEKAAAEKKAAAELARKRKPTPVPTPVRSIKPEVVPEPPKPATPTPGSARLRVVFQSPAPEGYVMIRRNDKEVFRRQFDFGRKSAGGLVEGTIEVPSGPATYKAWAIPTNRSFNGYESAELVVPGGETRTIALEINAAGKLVVSLR